MRIFFSLLLWVWCGTPLLWAQVTLPEGIENTNKVYQEYIKAVQFGYPESYGWLPIIELGSEEQVWLQFDDISGDIKNYTYTVIHCNADWQPSMLTEMQYIDGFSEGLIRNRTNAFRSKMRFQHYSLALPNDDLNFTKSGNYLVVVYEDEDDKIPVITRRLMVVESAVGIEARLVRPVASSKVRTHQEIDFVVNYSEDIGIRNPRIEVQATIVQNQNWATAIQGVAPQFINAERLIFDYQDKIVFPAMKEFRFVDLRSVLYKTDKVYDIIEKDTYYDVILHKDRLNGETQYSFMRDLNGDFTLGNIHERDGTTESEYVRATFALSCAQPFEEEVYVIGNFTDWQLSKHYKMTYDDITKTYYLPLFLKQGFYNYQYVVVDPKTKTLSYDDTEGNWEETENDYTILIYFRPIGGRYDRLVGTKVLNSIKPN